MPNGSSSRNLPETAICFESAVHDSAVSWRTSGQQQVSDLVFDSSAERGNNDDAGMLAGGITQKCDLPSVRRPRGSSVSLGRCRQTQRLTGTDKLYVDIVVVFVRAVPGKGDLAAVGRKARLRLDPGIGRQGGRGVRRSLAVGPGT